MTNNTAVSLPYLPEQNRVALADYLNREDVQVALAELTAACHCIAGAIFCTCEARLTLTEQQQELAGPLALAYASRSPANRLVGPTGSLLATPREGYPMVWTDSGHRKGLHFPAQSS